MTRAVSRNSIASLLLGGLARRGLSSGRQTHQVLPAGGVGCRRWAVEVGLEGGEEAFELHAVLEVGRPGAREVFDEGRPSAADQGEPRIDAAPGQGLGVGIGLEA